MSANIALPQSFYKRCVVDVVQDLLGKKLVFGQYSGIINETEAYRGADDPASHAFKGKTKRTAIMFGPAGYVYVYLIYGMYHCLNIVTGHDGEASAVLIRGLQLPDLLLNGPGKLCRSLGITKEQNGLSIFDNQEILITDGIESPKFIATPRIGIKVGTDKLWRFVVAP